MFGGDDVGTVVVDLGAGYSRFGYACDDAPRFEVASVAGKGTGAKKPIAPLAPNLARPDCEVLPLFSVSKGSQPGKLQHEMNEDVFESLLENMFYDKGMKMNVGMEEPNLSKNPLLFTEPSRHSRKIRAKMVEIAFEKFGTNACYVCKKAPLSSFSTGKTSAIVLDVGAQTASCTVVHEGYAMQESMQEFEVGGNLLTELIGEQLSSEEKAVVEPTYCYTPGSDGQKEFKVPAKTSKSFLDFSRKAVLQDVKESCLAFDDAEPENHQYRLPSGQAVKLPWRDRVGGLLFKKSDAPMPDFCANREQQLDGFPGLSKLVLDTISRCDVDLRKDLYNNVIFVGGGSLFPGIDRSFSKLLVNDGSVPAAVKVRVIASTLAQERQHSSWIGGSILGSLGSFQQQWISSGAYQEAGADIVEKLCP